ncbi:FMN-dependent oxidoreductase, nitrilotriacetate monooxygenase family [Kaistia soli DSM 19436]|uniref:FMN-dependent oxidoreductase, nitrilotriacetate monooxygenase family n=1 Tax=Kaistia soli DSM 19436 TaxID=1122133 RepID=A0A1M5LEQ2_9HYPH|nr:LLM class flavin-dependent oxidoreductase [Kaistia soli]SHG63584.1 FMN-dependent oxidoreductase, nitrilotriacetate monooxygenase family [Kaistia soli DSM 19436]
MAERLIHLNAFENASPVNISSGLWRHPDDQSHRYKDIRYWTELAQMLEAGGFDSIFMADVLGMLDVYQGRPDAALRTATQVPINDPVTLVSAMAAATQHIGFAVTVSLTYEQPYAFARTMTSLDHASDGRVGWNIVTSYLDSAARNLGRGEQLSHDERYDRGDEFMEVAYKLWEGSWEDGAVVIDKARGVYVDPAKVHAIGHHGRYFQVPDAFIAEPSVQRTPVLFQAGSSKRGQTFAATHAEGVFVHATRPEILAPIVAGVRASAAALGRDPRSIKAFAVATIVTGATDAEAEAKHRDLLAYADYEGAMVQFAGPLGLDVSKFDPDQPLTDINRNAAHFTRQLFADADPDRVWTLRDIAEYMGVGGMGPVFVGSGATVADEMQRWIDVADLDGFNLTYAIRPGTFADIVRHVVPELRRRGLMRAAYDGTTLRENLYGAGQKRLRDDHPGKRYGRG